MLSFRKQPSPAWPAAALVFALAAGLFLRAFQIGDQVLADDELHALAKLASTDYAGIATSFGVADHSIPLTLFYEAIANRGLLSEAWMLAPAWIAGLAAALFAPAVVRRAVSPLALATFAGLLAVSPLLVLYTRQARPYAITLLLALVAIWAAWRWWQEGRARHAVLYVACAVAAIYFHMIVAPMVLGVWVCFFLEGLFGRGDERRRLAHVVGMAFITTVLAGALIAPPLVHDWNALRAKTGIDLPTPQTLERTLLLMSGTASIAVAMVTAAFAAVGAVVLWHRFPAPTRYVVTLLVLQVVAVLVSGALWLSHALVLMRYLLVALPFFLFASAVGFAWCVHRFVEAHRPAGYVLAAAWVLAGYLTGPLPAALGHPNAFPQHGLYFLDFDPDHNLMRPVLVPGPIPVFYRKLGERAPGSLVVVEAPWRFEHMFNRLPVFQEVHRQRVKVGMVGGLCPPGMDSEHARKFPNRFRHFVDLAGPPGELSRIADYVVFHRKLDLSNMTAPWLAAGGKALADVEVCIERFRGHFGAPAFEDATITVFALKENR